MKTTEQKYDRETLIPITKRDAEMLIDLMDNPPPPNEALKRAFERHKELVKPNK